jgi:hypothetical protein
MHQPTQLVVLLLLYVENQESYHAMDREIHCQVLLGSFPQVLISCQKAEADSQYDYYLNLFTMSSHRTLVNVQPSSRGIYQCVVVSGIGDAKRMEFKLSVVCKKFC